MSNLDLKLMSIPEFCKSYGISRSMFYILKKRGHAPRTIKLGKRRLVSQKSAESWCEQMEQKTSEAIYQGKNNA